MSQTLELSSHYQHSPKKTMCQVSGKDAKKKKDGHIEWTADSFIQFTGKMLSEKESLLLWDRSLAWILIQESTDLGGRMNGWLKRLNLVAVCQCQLCSEVEVVERICCRYFQALTKVCKLPWAMWETNIRESNIKALNMICEKECFFSSLNWLTDILLNIYFVPCSTGDI